MWNRCKWENSTVGNNQKKKERKKEKKIPEWSQRLLHWDVNACKYRQGWPRANRATAHLVLKHFREMTNLPPHCLPTLEHALQEFPLTTLKKTKTKKLSAQHTPCQAQGGEPKPEPCECLSSSALTHPSASTTIPPVSHVCTYMWFTSSERQHLIT